MIGPKDPLAHPHEPPPNRFAAVDRKSLSLDVASLTMSSFTIVDCNVITGGCGRGEADEMLEVSGRFPEAVT